MNNDITFCSNTEKCGKKLICRREEHTEEEIHSYCPFCGEGECEFFLPKDYEYEDTD